MPFTIDEKDVRIAVLATELERTGEKVSRLEEADGITPATQSKDQP